jgi:hypothetical protein
MAKFGPKGAWKVKGKVHEELIRLFEENASVASNRMSDILYERTGVRVSSSRIRDFRVVWKKGRSMKPVPMVAYSRNVQGHRS